MIIQCFYAVIQKYTGWVSLSVSVNQSFYVVGLFPFTGCKGSHYCGNAQYLKMMKSRGRHPRDFDY